MIKIASVKFAIPKGSLEEATFKLLESSWIKVNRKSRTYRVYLDDSEIKVKMLRPQEIPNLVSDGLYDVGITGKDWINETKSDVEPLVDLEYGRIKLVIAMPDNYRYKSLDDMIETLLRNPSLRLSASQLKSTPESMIMLYKLNALPEWLWKKAHRHPIVRLLLEYVPPLDYLKGFGKDLMQDYLETSNT